MKASVQYIIWTKIIFYKFILEYESKYFGYKFIDDIFSSILKTGEINFSNEFTLA